MEQENERLVILPFEEWKSRLLSRGLSEQGNLQICCWQLDGKEDQWMFNEYTTFPHFGQVMAAAIDPKNHKAKIKSTYLINYVDATGNAVFKFDPDTYKKTGRKPVETFKNAYFDAVYYDYILWARDFDRACEIAYEMYRRRRLPTSTFYQEMQTT